MVILPEISGKTCIYRGWVGRLKYMLNAVANFEMRTVRFVHDPGFFTEVRYAISRSGRDECCCHQSVYLLPLD
jgi:hypothetical protein